jgi:sodium/potassium-transporting ATPase subunit beta
VWLSCEGENPADKEFIGTVEYIPHRGFPGYYYPFLGVKNYLSPLVAVHFKNITSEYSVQVVYIELFA